MLLISLGFSGYAASASVSDDESPPPLEAPIEDTIPSLPKRPRPTPPPSADWAQWNNVIRFRGYSECRRVNEMLRTDGNSYESGYTEDIGSGKFEFERPLAGSSGRWDLVNGYIIASHFAVNASRRTHYQGKGGSDAKMGGASTNFYLDLNMKEGTWSFHAGGILSEPYDFSHWLQFRKREGSTWVSENRGPTITRKTSSAHFSARGKLPTGRPTPLHGTWVAMDGTLRTSKTHNQGRVTLVPEYSDVELIVEIEGLMPNGKPVSYDQWIPRGTPTGAAGSRLNVKARLQARGGGAVTASVENFSFALNNTSREPGLCLNFPRLGEAAGGKPAAPDLKFAPGGETDAERQQLDMPSSTENPQNPHAETRIDCFDFGAWSDLTVTAELTDGRIITGHLKGDPSVIEIPLPKRSGGSLIADAWKAAHGTSASDVDDEEKLPSAGHAPGDGFTLYEEYRGFIENGRHIEGNPAKIDFFVRNYVGTDARPGIELFGDLTGAAVHHRLRSAEFDAKQRVMNANHDRGPHRVDQHGVFVRTEAGRDGAGAVFNRAGVRGRPVHCTGIYIQPREAQTAITTSENVPASDLIFAYDRAIAHELLHAVGVEHHGTGDGSTIFRFVYADDPRNKTGKPVFWIGYTVNRSVVKIIDEATGRDLAAMLEPDYLILREQWRESEFPRKLAEEQKAGSERQGYTFEFSEKDAAEVSYNNSMSFNYWYVGAEHGECAGDESCVTRYHFAKLYEKKGASQTFYYISDGQSERAGFALCRALVGTGINAVGRQPQPRYGDALHGWGECADWIVFNDAVPAEPEPSR